MKWRGEEAWSGSQIDGDFFGSRPALISTQRRRDAKAQREIECEDVEGGFDGPCWRVGLVWWASLTLRVGIKLG